MSIIPKRTTDSVGLPQPLDIKMPTIERVSPDAAVAKPVDFKPALDNISRIIDRAQNDADNIVTQDADNQLNRKANELIAKFGQEKGRKAFDSSPYNEELKQYGDKIKEGLNPRLYNKISPRFDSILIAAESNFRSHSDAEIDTFKKEVAGDGIELTVSAVLANSENPKAIADQMGKGRSIIIDESERLGENDEGIKIKLQKYNDTVYLGIIEKKLVKGDLLAKEFYDQNKNDISPELRTRIEAKLKTATTEGEGARIGREAVSLYPKDPEDADSHILEVSNGNEDVINRARIEYAYNIKIKDAQERAVNEEIEKAFYSAITGGDITSLADLEKTPFYINSSGIEKTELRQKYLSYINQDENIKNAEVSVEASKESDKIIQKYSDFESANKSAQMISNPQVRSKVMEFLKQHENNKDFANIEKQEDAFKKGLELINMEDNRGKSFDDIIIPKTREVITSAQYSELFNKWNIVNYEMIENQINITEDLMNHLPDLIRGKYDLNKKALNGEITKIQKTMLETVIKNNDPDKTDKAVNAYALLKAEDMRSYFKGGDHELRMKRAELTAKLQDYIINNFDKKEYDPVDYVDKLLIPAKEDWRKWFRGLADGALTPQTVELGQEGTLQERQEAVGALRTAGYPVDEKNIQYTINQRRQNNANNPAVNK